MSLKSINPFTNQLIKETEELSEADIEKSLIKSAYAFEAWRRTGFDEKIRLMRNVAEVLRRNSGKYASIMTSEMGKPITESKAEIEKCAWLCDYYAENASDFLKPDFIETDADSSYVLYEPLGTILGIMPWNFPFWQVFRFAVPTMAAGNTVVLKHASNVQMCAFEIENIFIEAGFPSSVFSNLAIGSKQIENVLSNDIIKAVSLTGSEAAGRNVGETAGKLLKKCVLELGGSNAFIVLDDADVVKAAETGIQARFQNAGQSCIAAKRFIVGRKISDDFISAFLEGVKKIKTGDPGDPEVRLGPLSSISQAETVESQIVRSVGKGAKVIIGGKRKDAFFEPTVVIDVAPGMPLFDEEVFGPVTPITITDSIEEAVHLAGKTTFGLGVTLFSRNIEKAEGLVQEFNDGSVFINGLVKSDPRLPFGGTRRSGYGRELSFHGIKEFVNVKTVWVKKP
ncbi:MAG TPA: NAD-dependent succinate-semialdehyde dehydrogenase [Bacteroidales bacterium]|nr:NAD-dependent succinate-semialdehyde dehydrogenase [Bacteroidales bacterium]